MLRITRSLASFLIAGAIAPVGANAAPFGALRAAQPTVKNAKAEKISFILVNKSEVTRAVTIDGQSYTLNPHQQLSISAPSGSQVTESASGSPGSAKLLFTVNRMHKGATIVLN